MGTGTVRVVPLQDAPENLPICARWLNDEWGRGMGSSLAETTEWLDQIAHANTSETALIATSGEPAVGVCLVVECDLDVRADLTPWLSSLFVAPEYRHKSIGRKLVGAIEAVARRAGAESLYLYTPGRETFFAELDWTTVERLQLDQGEFALMKKRL